MSVEKANVRDYVQREMLEDRYYMRQPAFAPRRSATMVLIVANIVVFVLQNAFDRFSNFPVGHYFALSADGLRQGFVWQVLTYQFMHAGLLHLLFNCYAIYLFGLFVEDAIGRRSFLALYFSSGIIGGLVQLGFGLAAPQYFGGPVVGASAAGFGLTAAFALLFPEQILMLFFVIPLKAKYLLLLSAVLAVAGMLGSTSGGPNAVHVADAAHLGGMFTGIFFVKYAMHWEWRWPRLRRSGSQTRRPLVRVSSGSSALWARNRGRAADEDVPAEDFLSKEVDPILDKISAHGIQSLTDRERRILEAARERIGKR